MDHDLLRKERRTAMDMVSGSETVLIVTGDDFGISRAVNEGIIQAHCEGILTSASLMVNGGAFPEAVSMAKNHPRLAVGIHLSLLRSKTTLLPEEIPKLVDRAGNFPDQPILAGLRFFFDRSIRTQLEMESDAQIRKFLAAGLVPSHIDGHLHLHVHPVIVDILVRLARKYSIPALRLPRESLLVNLRLDSRNLLRSSAYFLIYSCLCRRAERKFHSGGRIFPDRFFGLMASGRMNESYLLGLMDRLEPGVTEVGMHPAVSLPGELERWAPHYHSQEELQALISPRVKEKVVVRGIRLANYFDLGRTRESY
jgi:hopanoid biosynthesis associated protein HpnK